MATLDAAADITQVLDIAGTLSNLGGDAELFQELLEFFLELAPQQLEDLQAAVDARDIAAVDLQAHGMKGGAANVGAVRVREAARELEALAKAGSLDGAAEMMCQIRAEMATVLEVTPSLDWATIG